MAARITSLFAETEGGGHSNEAFPPPVIKFRSRMTWKDAAGDALLVLLDPRDPLLQSERTQGFAADPVYVRAKCLPMLGSLKT